MLITAHLLALESQLHVRGALFDGVHRLPLFLIVQMLGLFWRQVLPTRHLRSIKIIIALLAGNFVGSVIIHATIVVAIVDFNQPIFQNILARLRLALGRIGLLNLHGRVLLLRYLRAVLTANSRIFAF